MRAYVVAASLIFAAYASAQPITFEWTATVTVVDLMGSAPITASVDDVISGSFTFDANASGMPDPSNGTIYDMAVMSAQSKVGDSTVTFGVDTDQSIFLSNADPAAGTDYYQVFVRGFDSSVDNNPVLFGEFQIALFDQTGSALQTEELPLVPPALNGFDPSVLAQVTVFAQTSGVDISTIRGTLNSFTVSADTRRIDFETLGDGSPIDSLTLLPSSEYQGLGVVITDSFQSSNSFFVQNLDPVINDSSLSGFIATATAAAGVDPTWFELEFDVPAKRVAFDFLNASGNTRVLSYDEFGVLLGDKLFNGNQRFVHVPSSSVESRAGHAEVFGSNIVTVRIESGLPAGSIEALHIDNLEWSGNRNVVVYSNLGPEDEYSINNGWTAPAFCLLVDCPNSNGGLSKSFSFVSLGDYDLKSVELAITDISDPLGNDPDPATIDVGIYANASSDQGGSEVNAPAHLLGFETVTIPESTFCDPGTDPNCSAFSLTLPDSLTSVDFSQSGIRLLPGQRYWAGLHPNDPNGRVDGAWFWNLLEEGLTARSWGSGGGGPGFEFSSVAVGAPWQSTNVQTESAFRVTGTTPPDLDPDMDGIETRVDLAPDLFSADFSDISLGGATSGSITNRADLSFEISDAIDPSAGIELQVGDVGVGHGEIGVCENISLELSAGDQLIFTCGSTHLDVFKGPLELLIDGDVRVWASSDAEVAILEGTAEQEFRVENNGILGEVRVESDGVIEVLMPGESTDVTVNDIIFLSSFE